MDVLAAILRCTLNGRGENMRFVPRPTRRALLPFGLLLGAATSGCAVSRIALPAYPSLADEGRANKELAGRPAIVKVRVGEAVEERHVDAVQFDTDDTVSLRTRAGSRDDGANEAPSGEWSRVARDAIVEIDAVDRRKGVLKGLGIGAATGFVVTTLTVYGLFVGTGSSSCGGLGSTEGGGGCGSPGVSPGGALAAGAIVGLVASLVTGGLGYAIGSVFGDGTRVTLAPPPTNSGVTVEGRVERGAGGGSVATTLRGFGF
jgi:hypothetical protein